MLARLCLRASFRDVGKVVIEDDFGSVNAARDDEIRIHHAVVDVDHEIRIDPEIECALAFADFGGFTFAYIWHDRARLHTKTLASFDLVVAVIENAVQAAVNMRHVIAAVEIIVDEDFPVAVDSIVAAFEPLNRSRFKGSNVQ